MGGWFRKEIKTPEDLKGLKMRIGGFAGQVHDQARRGAAADRRRRHLSGAGKGHDRRRRMGRPLRRREARLQQGRAVSTTTRAGGKAARALPLTSTSRSGTKLPKSYQADRRDGGGLAPTWTMAKYDARNPQALKQLVAGGTKLRPFSQPSHGGLLQGRATRSTPRPRPRTPTSRRSTTAWRPSATTQYLWFQVAENTFDNFMMSQPPALKSKPHRTRKRAGPRRRGFFFCALRGEPLQVRRRRDRAAAGRLRNLDLDRARIDTVPACRASRSPISGQSDHDRDQDELQRTQGIAPQ